ncbi:hypothetical protein ACWGSK_26930 [Nocardiopsis sp. NPDC055551]
MNRCELTRWHPFKAGDDMPKNCVKPAGHAGMCRDYRGDYEGDAGRTREMSPEEVDAHNLSDEADATTDADNAVTGTDVPTVDTNESKGDAMTNAREIDPTELDALRAAGWTEEDLREHFGDAVSLPDVAEDVPLRDA